MFYLQMKLLKDKESKDFIEEKIPPFHFQIDRKILLQISFKATLFQLVQFLQKENFWHLALYISQNKNKIFMGHSNFFDVPEKKVQIMTKLFLHHQFITLKPPLTM